MCRKGFYQIIHIYRRLTVTCGACSQRASKCRNKVSFLEYNEVGEGHVEVIGESFLQSRKERERTSTEKDGSGEVAPVAQRRDSLYSDAVEDAGRYICLGKVAGHEVLDICLGEHTATRCHGIEVSRLQGKVVHLLIVTAHEHRHLIDESTCASRTVTVHTQFRSLPIEEHHLGILAADIYQCLCFRITLACKHRRSHNLLHKLSIEILRRRHTHGTRNAESHMHVGKLLCNLSKIRTDKLFYLGVMAFITRVNELVVWVEDGNFRSC